MKTNTNMNWKRDGMAVAVGMPHSRRLGLLALLLASVALLFGGESYAQKKGADSDQQELVQQMRDKGMSDAEIKEWFASQQTTPSGKKSQTTEGKKPATKSQSAPEPPAGDLTLDSVTYRVVDLSVGMIGTRIKLNGEIEEGDRDMFNNPLVLEEGIAQYDNSMHTWLGSPNYKPYPWRMTGHLSTEVQAGKGHISHWEGLPDDMLGLWEMPLDTFYGTAAVCDLTSVKPVGARGQAIRPEHLSNVRKGDIVLLWSPYRGAETPYLPAETAKWLADTGIKMLGVEIPGVNFETNGAAAQPDNSPTHRHLMGNNIPIAYPLANLSMLSDRVTYVGLPINFDRMEATWIRPIALTNRTVIAQAKGQAKGKAPAKGGAEATRIGPSGDLLEFDIAPPDRKWEFASAEWCDYAAKMGMKMLEAADLDLSKYNWAFSEEYTYTPERLMAGRERAGYYFMIKDGKISGGEGVPQECLDVPGFHVRVEWGLIAHPSSFYYGRQGSQLRGVGSRQLSRDLTAAGKSAPKGGEGTRRTNYDGPTWPRGVGESLSVDMESGGGLHNFTALHLKPSPEVKDLPQTEWGVAILTEMTDQQKEDFYTLIGRGGGAKAPSVGARVKGPSAGKGTKGSLVGSWTLTSDWGVVTLVVKPDLSGTLESNDMGGVVGLSKLTSDGTAVSFNMILDKTGQEIMVPFKGTIAGNAMKGEFSTDTASASVSGVRN